VGRRPINPGNVSEGSLDENKAHPLRLALEDAQKIAEAANRVGKHRGRRKNSAGKNEDLVNGSTNQFDTDTIDLATSRGRGRKKIPTSGKAWKTSNLVCELRILLNDSSPRIWRRVRVPMGASLYRLHCVIQVAMGWMEQEDFQFSQEDKLYTLPVIARKIPERTYDCRKNCIGQILGRVGQTAMYMYDFEDSWIHEIRVEKMYKAVSREELDTVVLLDGKRACPPEKSGGAVEYSQTVLPIIKNRSHRLHATYMAWAGINFKPDRLDIDLVNQSLATVLSSRRLADQL